jgi:hypothetical protein
MKYPILCTKKLPSWRSDRRSYKVEQDVTWCAKKKGFLLKRGTFIARREENQKLCVRYMTWHEEMLLLLQKYNELFEGGYNK